MANPTDFPHPQSQSGEQAHSQETGDDGLSNKMEHNFSDRYNGGALSVEEKGCGVRPIPQEEANTFPEMSEVPHPSVFGSDSKSVPAEVGVVQPGGLAVVEENNLPPQFPLKGQLDNRKEEEEAVRALPGTRVITEAALTEAGGESCIMDPKMDTGKNPAKSAPGVPKGGTKRNRYKKRAAGNNWKLFPVSSLGLLLAYVTVCEGAYVPTKPPADRNGETLTEPSSVLCFTCDDYDKCQNLERIFGPNESLPYERGSKDIEQCSKLPPTPKNNYTCAVCQDRSTVLIGCPWNYTEIDPELNGEQLNTTKGCFQQQPTGADNSGVAANHALGRDRYGLIAAVIGTLVIFFFFLIYCCWKCNRAKNGQQQTTVPDGDHLNGIPT